MASSVSIVLTDSEESIIKLIKANPRLTTAELKEKVKGSTRKFERVLLFLERAGKIHRLIGQYNRREWLFNEKADIEASQQPAQASLASGSTPKVKRIVKAQVYNYLIVYASYHGNQGKGEGNMEMKLNRELSDIKGIRQIESELVAHHRKEDATINRCVVRNFKLLNVIKEFESDEPQTLTKETASANS